MWPHRCPVQNSVYQGSHSNFIRRLNVFKRNQGKNILLHKPFRKTLYNLRHPVIHEKISQNCEQLGIHSSSESVLRNIILKRRLPQKLKQHLKKDKMIKMTSSHKVHKYYIFIVPMEFLGKNHACNFCGNPPPHFKSIFEFCIKF